MSMKRIGWFMSTVSIFLMLAVAAADTDMRLGFWGEPGTGALPEGWKPLNFEKIPSHSLYTLINEGGKVVVKAQSRAAASGLIREVDLKPAEYPVISWRWKVENLVGKSDPRIKEGDDYPARIYVTFRYDPERAGFADRAKYGAYRLLYGKYPPHAAINYIWGTDIPKGTALPNPYTDRTMMVVVESGPERLGQWVEERRDLYEDYRRLFGEEPPPVSGVAVMTDTDNTGESATAFYGDIVLHRKVAPSSPAGPP